MTCWHTDCNNEATHTIVTGEELCDLHLAVLRALHDQKKRILDPGLEGDPAVDLGPVDAAIGELTDAFTAPTKEG